MHIPPYKNKNIPIIDANNSRVPFVYFNNINLTKNKIFISDVIGYETCFVPVTGTFSVNVGNLSVKKKDHFTQYSHQETHFTYNLGTIDVQNLNFRPH